MIIPYLIYKSIFNTFNSHPQPSVSYTRAKHQTEFYSDLLPSITNRINRLTPIDCGERLIADSSLYYQDDTCVSIFFTYHNHTKSDFDLNKFDSFMKDYMDSSTNIRMTKSIDSISNQYNIPEIQNCPFYVKYIFYDKNGRLISKIKEQING